MPTARSRTLPRPALLAGALLAGLALPFLAGGCGSMSNEDRMVASVYLENAAQYYDAGQYERAIHQWARVLEMDASDDRARLGTAMAHYQLGRLDSGDGVKNLAAAESRLTELRDGGLGEMSWKAEIGYALVQERWADLYGRAVKQLEAKKKAGDAIDEKALATSKAELPNRLALAESSYRRALDDKRTEPNLQMTCWIGLAHVAAQRGEWRTAIDWARKYEAQIVQSKEFWKKQGDQYSSKLFGAELQEAELRDVLANCHFKLGEHETAEKELDLLIGLQPQRTDAYLNRGLLRHRRKAWDLARSDLRRFLAQTTRPAEDPTSAEAAKALLECEEQLASEK
jgi:tetratricopeptide (TPR) repeat protein